MGKALYKILLSLMAICICHSGELECQEVIIGAGVIPNRSVAYKKVIPIYENDGALYTLILENKWNPCTGYEYVREEWFPIWERYEDVDSIRSRGVEYYHSNFGVSYVYDGDWAELHYKPQFASFNSVYCPGRPVVGSEADIHIITDGPADSLIYIYSTDTLNTYEIYETFEPPADFIYLVSSPENSVVGALFYDGDSNSLFKFIAGAGEPIDISTPTEVIFCDYNISHAYDIILDDMAKVYFVLTIPADMSWGIHSIWSEEWGIRHLRESWDDALQGTSYQISFGPENGEILVIHGENYVGYLAEFFYSSDRGDVWYRSSFDINYTYYGSAPRLFTDTLHFIYYYGQSDNFTTYHYPIPVDILLDNLTSTTSGHLYLPDSYHFSNYPNPFNRSTTISFSLPEKGGVRLDIYDIAGRLVKNLINERMDAGEHSVVWDGTNSAGLAVSSGVYFYKLYSEGYTETRRMLLLK